jgi:hypothetical protein
VEKLAKMYETYIVKEPKELVGVFEKHFPK